VAGIRVRCVQFKRAFKRNDKPICMAVSKFIGHLVNQQVADDMIAFEIALLLLEVPSGSVPPLSV
jgi:pre-mRNA-splicing factor CWC22